MSADDIERRKRLEAAVEDDDWSTVIDGQTKLTEAANTQSLVEPPTATIIRCEDKCSDVLRISVRCRSCLVDDIAWHSMA